MYLNTLLREELQQFLQRDLERRMERPPGTLVYGYWWEPGDPGTAVDADLWAIRNAQESLRYDLAQNSPKEMAEYAEELVRKHRLPQGLLRPLTYGLIEAAIRGWEIAERRTLGTEPLVFSAPETSGPSAPFALDTNSATALKAARPLASTAFGDWARESGGWRAGAENQAKVSVALFWRPAATNR